MFIDLKRILNTDPGVHKDDLTLLLRNLKNRGNLGLHIFVEFFYNGQKMRFAFAR